MSVNLQVTKTLPHLIPLFVGEKVHIYSSGYSRAVYNYLLNVFTVNIGANSSDLFSVAAENWEKVPTLSAPLQWSQRGDVVDIWPAGYDSPVRLELFDEEIEKMYIFDVESGYSLQKLQQVIISTHNHLDTGDISQLTLNLDSSTTSDLQAVMFLQHVPYSLQDEDISINSHDHTYPSLFWGRFDLLEAELERWQQEGYQVVVASNHLQKLHQESKTAYQLAVQAEQLAGRHWSLAQLQALPAGFVSEQEKLVVLTDREVFGTIYLRSRKSADDNAQKLLREFEDEVSVGDFVVHEDYGIAKYVGLTQEVVNGQMQEFLQLQYAQEAELLLPLTQIEKLTRYIGPEGIEPELSKLGKAGWKQTYEKVKKSVAILAKELLEHYARREMAQAPVIESENSSAYQKFVEAFPYEETNDQLQATAEIMGDMQTPTPMNRLLIGDVGYGKTEVMLRAVYKMVEAGKQVAILCPTTVLAAQHYVVFQQRFHNTGYKIASLSRFNSAKENKNAVDAVNQGEIDIVIGTHRLLSKDLKFADLGLLVVDEEQRFGVRQKEKIKQMEYGVHYLSLSATPIPRTLSMSLSSIQDISMLTQAPKGRKPVQTSLDKMNWNEIVKAIKFELDRGGQVYFVHNSVRTLPAAYDKLKQLLPGVRIVMGHGQMPPNYLDKNITDFYQGKYDVLLSTTIIENGLDMPNVNTMIINNAQKFGLAQLYQLRGRVGRSQRQAYCYLFYKGVSENKDEENSQISREYLDRLQALVEASSLGSGFHIASRDLELRGAGDLLGQKQHGHMNHVGYALYMSMLAEEIERLKQVKQEVQTEYVTL